MASLLIIDCFLFCWKICCFMPTIPTTHCPFIYNALSVIKYILIYFDIVFFSTFWAFS